MSFHIHVRQHQSLDLMSDRQWDRTERRRGAFFTRRVLRFWQRPLFGVLLLRFLRLLRFRIGCLSSQTQRCGEENKAGRAQFSGATVTKRQHGLLLTCGGASATALGLSDWVRRTSRAPEFRALP